MRPTAQVSRSTPRRWHRRPRDPACTPARSRRTRRPRSPRPAPPARRAAAWRPAPSTRARAWSASRPPRGGPRALTETRPLRCRARGGPNGPGRARRAAPAVPDGARTSCRSAAAGALQRQARRDHRRTTVRNQPPQPVGRVFGGAGQVDSRSPGTPSRKRAPWATRSPPPSSRREDRQRYREKVQRCLDVFERMLRRVTLRRRAADDRAGDRAQPRRRDRRPGAGATPRCSRRSPTRTSRPSSASSTSRSTSPPRAARGRGVRRARGRPCARASTTPRRRPREAGAHMVMIGILPTLSRAHLDADALSANPRYQLLNEQIFAARGEDLRHRHRRRRAAEHATPTRSPPRPPARASSCTCRSAPSTFARVLERRAGDRRRRSSRSAPTRRSSSASELWRETRIALFEQATDTRPRGAQGPGRAAAGVVRRALDHLDLRPVRGERPLLPGAAAGASTTRTRSRCSRRGGAPQLPELRLHNGTIYRWNRPVYDVVDGRPHLRVENRVLPAGPTVVDIARQRRLLLRRSCARSPRSDRPLWSQMSFSRGRGELPRAARATASTRASTGPGSARCRPTELVLRRLLPMAHEGLDALGRRRRRRATGCSAIIERRCVTAAERRVAGRPRPFHRLYEERTLDRADALREMTVRYREHMHANEPVHTWPVE